MAGKSSIAKQPAKARKIAERAARDPGSTIHATTEAMNAAGAKVSKSAVGRWLKDAREQLAEYQQAQEVARLWTKELGENPDGDTGVMISETLKLLAGRVIADLRRRSDAATEGDEDAVPVSAQELMLAAKALDHVAGGDAKTHQRRMKERAAAIEQASKRVGEVGKRIGVSQQSIEEIQRELGLLPK